MRQSLTLLIDPYLCFYKVICSLTGVREKKNSPERLSLAFTNNFGVEDYFSAIPSIKSLTAAVPLKAVSRVTSS